MEYTFEFISFFDNLQSSSDIEIRKLTKMNLSYIFYVLFIYFFLELGEVFKMKWILCLFYVRIFWSN